MPFEKVVQEQTALATDNFPTFLCSKRKQLGKENPCFQHQSGLRYVSKRQTTKTVHFLFTSLTLRLKHSGNHVRLHFQRNQQENPYIQGQEGVWMTIYIPSRSLEGLDPCT